MNKREENLISILYEKKNRFMIIDDMAKNEGCSDKTIRNELDKIEKYLSKFSSDLKLERIRGKGIRLKVKESSKITLTDILDNKNIDEDILSTNNRRLELAYTLLMSTKPVTLNEIAERYYVNENIISNDLDEIGERLKKYNLKIVSKQRVGTFLEGLENDKREALSQGIKDLGEFNKSKSTLKSIFMSYEIDLVNKAIIDLQEDINIYFTDESSNALAIHVLFMIKRIKLNQTIGISKDEKSLVKIRVQYLWALKLTEYLKDKLSLEFPENEIAYLAVHLLGIRYSRGNDIELIDFSFETGPNIMDILLYRLLNNMEKICKMSFRTDEILIKGLKLHLYGSFNRIKYGLSLENPLFEDIKQMSPYLYYEALDTVDRFNSEYNINIPKEEVAYITVHFQASIERNNKGVSKKYSAVIVCHLGIGVSNYLQIKLEKIFPWMNFKDNVSLKEIKKHIKKNPTNFVFSTVDIDHLDIMPIKINPIIDETEEIRMRKIVRDDITFSKSKDNTRLHEFMGQEFIFLNKKFKDRVEVIEFMTSNLYKKGRVDFKFRQSVFQRETIDSTEIGNLLAIPHGNTDHIILSTIEILTLEKPILWGKEQVQIIFLLAVKKKDYSKDDTMSSFFKYLNNLSNDEECLKRLLKEDYDKKFVELLRQYFNINLDKNMDYKRSEGR